MKADLILYIIYFFPIYIKMPYKFLPDPQPLHLLN